MKYRNWFISSSQTSRWTLHVALVTTLFIVLLTGCTGGISNTSSNGANETESPTDNLSNDPSIPTLTTTSLDTQPSTVYYEIFVRSFYDSDGDGIGDFKGLTEKLDYLNDGNPDTDNDLGIGGIWLMPINTSPSYHGYDVSNYREVNPDYGTMEDFTNFINEAHKRGIKVIMDLVVNHTSSENPWFAQSAKDKSSKYRNWYVWAEDSNRSLGGTSAASTGDPWHTVEGEDDHYLGIFWGGMPDLNFDNQEVRDEMKDIGKFWLEKGLDGFRVDAAKHIYEDLLTDKSQETTDKNVAWWQEFRSGLVQSNPNTYLVSEVWDKGAVTVASYLNKAFDSSFNFSLAETIIQSAKSERDNNIGFILERTYKLYTEKSSGEFVDATFLTNHDLNRVMSQLEGNKEHAKMAASLLLTLPGNPFIYYGEEIGMLGVKPDEGIREPMVWFTDDSAAGQTTWQASINNHGTARSSVEEQLSDPDSLLSHYRQIIRWKSSIPALRDGGIQEYTTDNASLAAYIRQSDEETVLVVHNLTGKEQTLGLALDTDLGEFKSILQATKPESTLTSNTLTLPAYTTVILK
ncbi:glycosidase [Paenibacillus anaericanus]|uniref:alpha-amylase family glycosyl hydrolase n=1 Tax=Paenibacillus anaericanus TaxID=170367 RepID=UPI002781D0BE|nr:alpha-amylase family glycosyl hydrolase [Paenibacillus anaericanus]MDQ0089372.1 glycosidase [Paenibacillus anaericanus]